MAESEDNDFNPIIVLFSSRMTDTTRHLTEFQSYYSLIFISMIHLTYNFNLTTFQSYYSLIFITTVLTK